MTNWRHPREGGDPWTRVILANAGIHRRFGVASAGELAHHADQVGLAFETDAGQRRQGDVAVLHVHAVGKAAEGLEQVRVAFVAAQAQPGGNRQGHLVAAVWNAARR